MAIACLVEFILADCYQYIKHCNGFVTHCIWEVNHEINLIDPKKHIHYQMLKFPEHFCKELSQKIEGYTTAQWWTPAVAHQVVPMLCIPKKNDKLCTILIYKNIMTTQSRMWCHSLTKISFTMIWPGPHIDQSSICLKHMNKYHHTGTRP